MTAVQLEDVITARRRLSGHVLATPLRHSPWLSAITGAAVWLKLESVQLTGSFKIRGAFNALLRLRAESRAPLPAIVTASAGNHGRAMACAAGQLGLRTIVFTPRTAPETKKAAIRRHGADLRDDAPDYDAAEAAAREYARREGVPYLSPYNHPDVIAGAATAALEIVDALPEVDAVVVPIGGGGLASGVGLVAKALSPRIATVGVEAAASTPFAQGLAAGRIVTIDVKPSLADGLTGNLEPGSMTFDLVRRVIDRVVAVGEDQLRAAIRGLADEEHLIAEGAGAAATAAMLAGLPDLRGKRVVAIVSGSNIDSARLAQLLS